MGRAGGARQSGTGVVGGNPRIVVLWELWQWTVQPQHLHRHLLLYNGQQHSLVGPLWQRSGAPRDVSCKPFSSAPLPARQLPLPVTMATITGNPQLIDVVDEEWARDTLPSDSKRGRLRHAPARRFCSSQCPMFIKQYLLHAISQVLSPSWRRIMAVLPCFLGAQVFLCRRVSCPRRTPKTHLV